MQFTVLYKLFNINITTQADTHFLQIWEKSSLGVTVPFLVSCISVRNWHMASVRGLGWSSVTIMGSWTPHKENICITYILKSNLPFIHLKQYRKTSGLPSAKCVCIFVACIQHSTSKRIATQWEFLPLSFTQLVMRVREPWGKKMPGTWVKGLKSSYHGFVFWN